MCDLIQKCDSCECVTYVTCVSDVWFLCDICNVHSDAWLNFNVLLHSDVWLMWMCDFCDALFGCLLRAWQRRSSMCDVTHMCSDDFCDVYSDVWLIWRAIRMYPACMTKTYFYAWRDSHVLSWLLWRVFRCVNHVWYMWSAFSVTYVRAIQMCDFWNMQSDAYLMGWLRWVGLIKL